MNPDNHSAEEVIRRLGLAPLPKEGGFFRETYRSDLSVFVGDPPVQRSAGTAIHYLLTPESFSSLHRLRFDEVYHFYSGDPVRLVLLSAEGDLREVVLGRDLDRGQTCQAVASAGHWQGSRLMPGGRWALLGTTMAPGFAFADFELAGPEILDDCPCHAETLRPLIAPG